jgi:hypothetical protein
MTIISTIVSSGIAGALVGGIQGAMFGKWQTATQPLQRIAHLLQLVLVFQSSSVRMPAFIIQTMTHDSISAVVLFAIFEQVRQLISSSSSSCMATAGSGAIAGVSSTLVTSQLASTINTNTNTNTNTAVVYFYHILNKVQASRVSTFNSMLACYMY